jgi:hypothetical protein
MKKAGTRQVRTWAERYSIRAENPASRAGKSWIQRITP